MLERGVPPLLQCSFVIIIGSHIIVVLSLVIATTDPLDASKWGMGFGCH